MAYLRKTDGVPDKGKGSKLSTKMKAFIDEYFVDSNASKAVLRAGYKTSNPNKLAAELKQHPLVAEEIKKREAERKQETELQADYLINKLINIIDSTEEKTSDQLKAIELAGKTLALWKDRQEISGPDGGALELEQKKVQDDAADFTRSLSRLAKRAGAGEVSEFPKPRSEG